MRKIYAASCNLFILTAEADRVLCQLMMFLTVLFALDVQNEMQLLSRVICYLWLVCLLGFLVESILGDPGAVSRVNKMFVVKKNI